MLIRTKTTGDRSQELTWSSAAYQAYAQGVHRYIPWLPSDKGYNITLSHERRFIWYRVAKVCTRSIFAAFDAAGVKLDADHPDWCYYPPDRFRDYLKFAFVRNPFGRLISCWRNKVVAGNLFGFPPEVHQGMQDFNAFVDWAASENPETCDRHIRPQWLLIDLNHVDVLGRFETFESDFLKIADQLGLVIPRIPHRNATSQTLNHPVYSEASRKRVAEFYAKDFALFGYDPERLG